MMTLVEVSTVGQERRVSSVLLCELVGSTEAAEDADPEVPVRRSLL